MTHTSRIGPVRMYRTKPLGGITGLIADASNVRPVLQINGILIPGYVEARVGKIQGALQYEVEYAPQGTENWVRGYIGQYFHAGMGPLVFGTYKFRARIITAHGPSIWSLIVVRVIKGLPVPPTLDVDKITAEVGENVIVSWPDLLAGESMVVQKSHNGGTWTQVYSGTANFLQQTLTVVGAHSFRGQLITGEGTSEFGPTVTTTVSVISAGWEYVPDTYALSFVRAEIRTDSNSNSGDEVGSISIPGDWDSDDIVFLSISHADDVLPEVDNPALSSSFSNGDATQTRTYYARRADISGSTLSWTVPSGGGWVAVARAVSGITIDGPDGIFATNLLGSQNVYDYADASYRDVEIETFEKNQYFNLVTVTHPSTIYSELAQGASNVISGMMANTSGTHQNRVTTFGYANGGSAADGVAIMARNISGATGAEAVSWTNTICYRALQTRPAYTSVDTAPLVSYLDDALGAYGGGYSIVVGHGNDYEEANGGWARSGTAPVNPELSFSAEHRIPVGAVARFITHLALLKVQAEFGAITETMGTLAFSSTVEQGAITLEQLLAQNAGLSGAYDIYASDQGAEFNSWITNSPGPTGYFEAKYEDNPGYYEVASRFVEYQSGIPFLEYVNTRILSQIGIPDTGTAQDDPDTAPLLYNGGGFSDGYDAQEIFASAASGMLLSAAELFKILQEVVRINTLELELPGAATPYIIPQLLKYGSFYPYYSQYRGVMLGRLGIVANPSGGYAYTMVLLGNDGFDMVVTRNGHVDNVDTFVANVISVLDVAP